MWEMYTCPLFLLAGKILGGRILDVPGHPDLNQAIGQSKRTQRAELAGLVHTGERKAVILRLWKDKFKKGKG